MGLLTVDGFVTIREFYLFLAKPAPLFAFTPQDKKILQKVLFFTPLVPEVSFAFFHFPAGN